MGKINLGYVEASMILLGNEVVYPNPVKEGLLIWYDFQNLEYKDDNEYDYSKLLLTNYAEKDLSNTSTPNLNNFLFKEAYKKGIKFDGIDDKLIPFYTQKVSNGDEEYEDYNILNLKNINNGHKFTIEMCFKMTDKLIEQGSEVFMTEGTYGRFWIQFIKSSVDNNEFVIRSAMYFGTEGGRSIEAYSTQKGYKYGDEFYICVTVDKNDKMTMRINDNFKGENNLNDIDIVTKQEERLNVTIGYSSGYYRKFDHELYSMRFYNRVLSDEEIEHNYQIEKKRWDLI